MYPNVYFVTMAVPLCRDAEWCDPAHTSSRTDCTLRHLYLYISRALSQSTHQCDQRAKEASARRRAFLGQIQQGRCRLLQYLHLVGRRNAVDVVYPGKGVGIALKCDEHRKVAAGQNVVRAESPPGAEEGGVRAVGHRVVVETAGSDARRLRQ